MEMLEQILHNGGIKSAADLETNMDSDIYDRLYQYWAGSMPYGTAKARSGDPDEFIYTHTCDLMGWD